jgi:hypothetical protein
MTRIMAGQRYHDQHKTGRRRRAQAAAPEAAVPRQPPAHSRGHRGAARRAVRADRIANGSSRFSPSFLSEFVLYALSAADVTMLAALVFVLARNVVKLIVERRRALPFARFRAKLVLLLLGMTFVPAVLVLLVGSELIRTSTERWFNAPMDEILSSANTIASDYYHERQMLVTDHAKRMARELGSVDLRSADVRRFATCSRPTSRCSACNWSRSTACSRRTARCRDSNRSSTWPRRRCRPATAVRRPIGWRRRHSADRRRPRSNR